mmetsp:Transcript_138554/g.254856  ORF Transcript_138554/g.254856 Transcript_138554/m.254856 type:complete len:392 (+) Transcript_138554:93-1268(+)
MESKYGIQEIVSDVRENVRGLSQNVQDTFESTKDALRCRTNRTMSVDEFSDVPVAVPVVARSGCLPRRHRGNGLTRQSSSADEPRRRNTERPNARPPDLDAALEKFYKKIKAEVLDEMRTEMRAQTRTIRELQEEIVLLRAKQDESTCWNFLTCWKSAGSVQPRRPSRNLSAEKPMALECEAPAVAADPACLAASLTDTSAAKPFGFDKAEVLNAVAHDPLHLSGVFTDWKVNQENARLQPVWIEEPGADVARLRLCVQMSSQTLSFCVVCAPRGWKWRLYPRDARNVFGTHASKQGRLRPDQPDAVAIAVGDKWKGHKLNFHVVEDVGTVVTIWVEVPLKRGDDGQVCLRFSTARGARVWYTKEDTGVQCVGGDGIDLSKYAYMRSVFED